MTPQENIKAFQLRMPNELHQKLKTISDQTEISMNQLLLSVLTWAAEHAHVGKPYDDVAPPEEGILTAEQPHSVWFGRVGGDIHDERDGSYQGTVQPYIAFEIDFSMDNSLKWEGKK